LLKALAAEGTGVQSRRPAFSQGSCGCGIQSFLTKSIGSRIAQRHSKGTFAALSASKGLRARVAEKTRTPSPSKEIKPGSRKKKAGRVRTNVGVRKKTSVPAGDRADKWVGQFYLAVTDDMAEDDSQASARRLHSDCRNARTTPGNGGRHDPKSGHFSWEVGKMKSWAKKDHAKRKPVVRPFGTLRPLAAPQEKWSASAWYGDRKAGKNRQAPATKARSRGAAFPAARG